MLASRASSIAEFQLVFGVLVGAGGGAIFAPLMATVTAWFDRQRSLAVSLVSAGIGVAPMTVAPIAARLVSTYNWRFSQLSIGLAVWALLLPAAFLVRRAPPAARAERRVAEAEMTVRQALTSPQFAVLAGTYFLCCATHSGPLFHTVSYAVSCGLPVMAAEVAEQLLGLAEAHRGPDRGGNVIDDTYRPSPPDPIKRGLGGLGTGRSPRRGRHRSRRRDRLRPPARLSRPH